MRKDYSNYLEKLEDKSLYEALELTFTKAFPSIIENCEDEKESSNMFISFLYLVEALSTSNDSVFMEHFAFYNCYSDFCDKLFDMIDSCSVNDARIAYEMLTSEINHTITNLIIEGLQNGTISPADLEGPSDEDDGYDDANLEKLSAFMHLDNQDKATDILNQLTRILELLSFSNNTFDEDNDLLPVLDRDDDTHTSLDTMYSYILAIQHELGKLIEHAEIFEVNAK